MAKYSDEIRRGGVSYQEMFKKIKSELVRREKVIL
jgi:capsid protein